MITRLLRRRWLRGRAHDGILIRISTVNGPIMLASSDQLYYSARYAGPAEVCAPDCLPGCTAHGWLNLVAGSVDAEPGQLAHAAEFSTVPLKIEIKAARLYGL